MAKQPVETVCVRYFQGGAGLVDQAHHTTADGNLIASGEGGIFLWGRGETFRIVSSDIQSVARIFQEDILSILPNEPCTSSVFGILHIRGIATKVGVGDSGICLLGCEAEPVARNRIFFFFVHGGEIVGVREWEHGRFRIPSLEDESVAVGRFFAPVFRHCFAIDGVPLQLRAVRVLEYGDRGADDLKIRRHLRITVLVVLAAAREDEDALTVHAPDPVICSRHLIVQRFDTHFDIVQSIATAEHLLVAFLLQFSGKQLGGFDQAFRHREHTRITTLRQLFSRQFRRLDQGFAVAKHICVTIRRQLSGRQFRSGSQPYAVREHAGITPLLHLHRRQFRHLGQFLTEPEHGAIARWSQLGGWQFRHSREFQTPKEHATIASIRQLRGGQCGRSRDPSVIEHMAITIIRHFSGWQFGRFLKIRTTAKHEHIA